MDGLLRGVALADENGDRLLIDEIAGTSLLEPTGQSHIFWIDRKAGSRTELTGPWGDHASLMLGEQAVSPGGLYALIMARTAAFLNTGANQVIYCMNLQTRKAVKISLDKAWPVGWSDEGGRLLAVASKGQPNIGATIAVDLVDPQTGAVVGTANDDVLAALGVGNGRTISPDGKLKFVLRPHEALDIINTTTGNVRTFAFNPRDRRFASDYNFGWLDSRYVRFDTIKAGFIDTTSMKMGYLPQGEGDDEFYRFSPDFKWAVKESAEGVLTGRVVEPSR